MNKKKEEEMVDRTEITVLLIEDDANDAFMIQERVSCEKNVNLKIEHLSDLTAGIKRIKEGGIDIVISDLGLPESYGLDTLTFLLPVAENLPVIVLTGLSDHKVGAEAVSAGAQDYIFKEELNGSLLVRSILYAMARKKMEVEREKLVQELQTALAKVKLLSGFLPICCSCKKIRDDKGYWQQIESYISKHSEAEFSHGICQECSKKLYPNFYKNAQF